MCCSVVLWVTVVLVVVVGQTLADEQSKTLSLASAANCDCSGLTCICCASLDSNTACLDANFLPSDLALNINIRANGNSVYQTKIDAANFPICAPAFPAACWAFNRIHIENGATQFCSQIKLGPIPIIRVPCLTYTGDSLIATPNTY